ncbi:zf-TFIIB domain-containing protein [Mycolicibacterium llatzerense]|nr:zf-TFIIB domain-containing protein [Mycolicibacterium llatzerense]
MSQLPNSPSAKPVVLCPKCVSQMLPVARFGVEIDQCTGCGGIFLDQGELEQLSQAEARFYAASQPPPAQQYPQPGYQQSPYPPGRGGFLGGLFSSESHGYGHRRGHH